MISCWVLSKYILVNFNRSHTFVDWNWLSRVASLDVAKRHAVCLLVLITFELHGRNIIYYNMESTTIFRHKYKYRAYEGSIHIIDLVVINVTIRGCFILKGMFYYKTRLDNLKCQGKNKCGLIKAIILNFASPN